MIEQPLHIAVGVISNDNGEVLVALRPDDVHQGGLWEFPGGKVEAGEAVGEALARELREELNVSIDSIRPLIRIRHDYPEYPVLLDVWRVEAWQGEISGREGQRVDWVDVKRLHERDFPAANQAIVKALQLPALYLVTPDRKSYDESFLHGVEQCLRAGVQLLQLRCPRLDEQANRALAAQVLELCRDHDAIMMINAGNPGTLLPDAAGVHLPAAKLLQLNERPLDDRYWVAASCHNRVEVEHACRLGLDFIVVGPVLPTPSHPHAQPLGWDGCRALAECSSVPVYALGGLSPRDMERAWHEGAQGMAMISAIWSAPDPAAAVRACN